VGYRRGAYRVLVGTSEGRRSLGKPGDSWEGNVKMDLQEVGWRVSDLIHLGQDRGRWRVPVNAVINLP
jgi:hypothetical protein